MDKTISASAQVEKKQQPTKAVQTQKRTSQSGKLDKSKRGNSDEAKREYIRNRNASNVPSQQAVKEWLSKGDKGRRAFYLKHHANIDSATRDKNMVNSGTRMS